MNEDRTRAHQRRPRPAHGNIGPADPHADPATDPSMRPVAGWDQSTPRPAAEPAGDRPWPAAAERDRADRHREQDRDRDRDPGGDQGWDQDADDRYDGGPTVALPGSGRAPGRGGAPEDSAGHGVHPGDDTPADGEDDRWDGPDSGSDDRTTRDGAAPSTGWRPARPDHSRSGGLWTGLIVSAVVLIFLLVFVLQNLDEVSLTFLGLTGTLPLGVAVLLAAIAGLLLVAVPGGLRIRQLRRMAERRAVERPR